MKERQMNCNLEYLRVKDYDVASYKSMFHLFTAPRIKRDSEPANWSYEQPINLAGYSALCSACSPRNDSRVCSVSPVWVRERGKKKLALTLAEILIPLGISCGNDNSNIVGRNVMCLEPYFSVAN